MLTDDIDITALYPYEGKDKYVKIGYVNDDRNPYTVSEDMPFATYRLDGNTYKYKVGVLGKVVDSGEVVEYVVLTNKEDITFDYIVSNKDKTDEQTRQEFVILE